MAPAEKRRRKRTRTAAYSSDSQSDSDSDSSSQSSESVAEKNADSSSEPSELSESAASEPELEAELEPSQVFAEAEMAREFLHKAPSQTQEEFNQVYLNLVTEQFANELESLRRANDFGPGSLELLVAGLKQGANIFDEEQKRMILSGKNSQMDH